MNKPLTRRLFGKLAAAAPLAAKGVASPAAQAEAASQMAMAGIRAATGPASTPYGGAALRNPAMMAAWKMGLAPDWVREDIRHSVADSARYLTPDVAALRSVSLSGKVAINVRRLEHRFIDIIERSTAMQIARDAFWRKERGDA